MIFTYSFIEKLGTLNTGISKCCSLKCCPVKYLTYFNEFENESAYKKHLENYLKDFRHEIQSLPFSLPTKQARKTFLNNLYDELLLTKETLDTQFKHAISKSYKLIYVKKRRFRFYLPRAIQKKCLTNARQAYHKIFFAYQSQNNIIEKSIEILKISASNDGVELKVLEKQLDERVKTDLSSPELSYLFYLILETVSIDKQFNRSNLSKIIASNFSTKKSLTPQPTQIRKHFTQVDDSIKNRVENLFFELSRKVKSK